MKPSTQVAIGLGSNVGDRLRHLQHAFALLPLREKRLSLVLETEALLLEGSPPEWNRPYLNAVACGTTDLPAHQLLAELKRIEQLLGPRTARWSPRIMDLDLLAYGDLVLDEAEFHLPHPELLNRYFTLYPMAQLMPYWRHPIAGKTLVELLEGVESTYIRAQVATTKLIGVVNVTPDSFSDGGQFVDPEKSVQQALQLWHEGASFIDLGAASTRPGATRLTHEEEWARLKPHLAALRAHPMRLSVDTYHNETALRALDEYDVEMINFLGTTVEPRLARQLGSKPLVMMHSLTIPADRSTLLPFHEDPIEHLLAWGKKLIEQSEVEQLIIDPGIGFGKTALQNMHILKDIGRLKSLGKPLYVGHSRKSFLQLYSNHRDAESAAITPYLARAGVEYIRVHNVEASMQQLVTQSALCS